MSTEMTVKRFDYSTVETDTKGKLIHRAARIRKLHATGCSTALEIGEELSGAREDMARHGDGTFCKWVEVECGFSKQTAYNFIHSYERFGKDCQTVRQLEVTAMYILASPSTPKLAFNEATKLADKGVKVTAKVAKAIIKKHTSNGHAPRKSSAPPAPDYGKCPNCGGTKWTDQDGIACAKCHHPHGEPVGDVDKDRIGIQRSKTVKTVEALMRAFDDLNQMLPNDRHRDAINNCKVLLNMAKGWK